MGSINKVIFGSDTLIDLTEDTVSPETLGKGVTAHDKSGVPIVGTMESGGSLTPATKKEVNFYDYDGTILYSYTVAEAAALTELPALPSHDGLVCQGWNWTLDGIKAMGGAVDVGAMYITDDGKTRVYIRIEDGRTSPMLGCCPKGTVTVDWGDGTTPDVLTGTSTSTPVWTPTHEYAAPGDYVISLTVDGSMGFYGDDNSAGILRYASNVDGRNIAYLNAVRRIEIGGNVTSTGEFAFVNCTSLSNVIIPNDVTINIGAFYSCVSLSNVIIPDGVTINMGTFYKCTSLSNVIIPDGVSSIGDRTFQNCQSLASITIPDNVTSIGSYAFAHCYGVRYYDFTRHTAVPTLSGTNAFQNIAADCEIRVPAALADEWKAATNWAKYADYIVGV